MTTSLKTYEILKAGNLTDEHAHAVTFAIQDSESEAMADIKSFIRDELTSIRRELASLEARIEARIDAKIAESKAELMRWMFLFWVTQIGITFAMLRFGK